MLATWFHEHSYCTDIHVLAAFLTNVHIVSVFLKKAAAKCPKCKRKCNTCFKAISDTPVVCLRWGPLRCSHPGPVHPHPLALFAIVGQADPDLSSELHNAVQETLRRFGTRGAKHREVVVRTALRMERQMCVCNVYCLTCAYTHTHTHTY